MRRMVRDRVTESIEQTKPQMEDFIIQRLLYTEAFPYVLSEVVASIREIRKLRVTPLFKSDYPPVEIVVLLRASLIGSASRHNNDFGSRTFDVDVELDARGTVRGNGTYDILLLGARLKAWWAGMEP